MNAKKIASSLKLLALCFLTGLLCGVIGTLFSKGISLVTDIRHNNYWLIYFLPIAGVLSVLIYKLLNVNNMGTNQVIESADGKTVLSYKLAPAVFFASLLSHLCGASVGREGAALQLGGSSAILLSKPFKVTEREEKILIYCGMAGLFSAVFGTPLAATVFALEVVSIGHIKYKAIIPTIFSSFVSYFTAVLLGAPSESFIISEVPQLKWSVVFKVLLLSLFTICIATIFCLALKYFEKILEKLLKNDYLRIAIGGTVIILLTILLKTNEYNGAGMDIIERIFEENEFVLYAFALKILFTCISVASGYKGGEIVPTLFIGATFGAFAGTFLGLPVAFSAALCMILMFCDVTNCPLASVFLAVELFSGKGIGYISVAVIISFFISGKISLYRAQRTDGHKALI